jgi:phytoene/squalene synthetase
MTQNINRLAASITYSSSKQTYYTIKFLVDRPLVFDAYKAYAYYRWLDDQVDNNSHPSQGIAFIKRQRQIINRAYKRLSLPKLSPKEKMIVELIYTDTQPNSQLTSFIRNFFSVIEFDAHRIGRPITQAELDWYSKTIGIAVTDCIQYFIGHNQTYPVSKDQYLAATAAHIIHMLRDFQDDIKQGFINLPANVSPQDLNVWVKNRISLARGYFKKGKAYINQIKNLRCRLAALAYCARFERCISNIQKASYSL